MKCVKTTPRGKRKFPHNNIIPNGEPFDMPLGSLSYSGSRGNALERTFLRPITPGTHGLSSRPTDAAAEPTPFGRAVPAGAPHLRVLHDLGADGECAEPLLKLRAQFGARHTAVVAAGETRRKCLAS